MEIKKIEINVKSVLSLIAIIIGILFYLLWGITYNIWADVGIYSVSAIFIVLGVLGLLFAREK
jgi:hypothetical protein